nr:MAG TPA: hypothetical protein [Caudoviricetes sp.]
MVTIKRLELIYNGVKSEFNAYENGGRGGTISGNEWISWFIKYSVRPIHYSKACLSLSKLV